MGGVRIVTDSACDLTPELAERHRIIVVPLTIRFGHEELLDRRDLSPAQFWERCKASSELPETAAPPPGAFHQAFEEAGREGSEVLCLTISSGVSATYQSALAAREGLDGTPVTVIDTRSLSMGQGLLAIAAAEAAADGATFDEVARLTTELIGRTRVLGVIDNLDHLQRGGRIGGARALLGSMLSIKPVIQVRDGVVEQESRQRTRSRSLRYAADKVKEDAPIDRLAVANGAASDVGELLEMMNSTPLRHERLVVDLGPVVGTHAGPGTIGICYQVTAG
jgi:DegV family protein with EDD domain